MNRREKLFLFWALAATLLVVVFTGAIVIFALPRTPTRVAIGSVDAFPLNAVTEAYLSVEFPAPDARGPSTGRIWVVRDAEGNFTAFLARSTHLGEPVNWVSERRRFEDPMHGAKWSSLGEYLEGPAPRGLDRFPVLVENNQVFVLTQLIYGASNQSSTFESAPVPVPPRNTPPPLATPAPTPAQGK